MLKIVLLVVAVVAGVVAYLLHKPAKVELLKLEGSFESRMAKEKAAAAKALKDLRGK